MTQIELDAKLRELNAQMNAEYKDIEQQSVENLRKRNAIKAGIYRMQEEIDQYVLEDRELAVHKKDIARRYQEQRNLFIKEHASAMGQRLSHNETLKSNEAYSFADWLKHRILDMHIGLNGVDRENIKAVWNTTDSGITYTVTLPFKKTQD